jgi:hypothetical protein
MMRNKSALLSGAAIGVLLAMSFGASANAKAAKHHHAAAKAGPSALEQKVDSLTEALGDVETRLNAATAAQQASAAQIAQAQSDAAAARADAAAAHQELAQQIQTIPGAVQDDVKTAVAANKPKPSWADNTTVGGTIFFDMTNLTQRPAPAANASNVLNKNENGFNYDLKRFYISIDHKFNDIFSANFTSDFTYDNATVSGQTATIPASDLANTTGLTCTGVAPKIMCTVPVSTAVSGDKVSQLYIKKAYLQAKLSDALIFRVGAADLPWVPFVEGIYGYRYVENVLIDRTKYGTSTDWGIHVMGTLPVNNMVTVSYQVSGINGLGYKQPAMGTVNRSNSMDVEGRVSATVDKHLILAVGGFEGKQGLDVAALVPNASNLLVNPAPQTAYRADALIAWVDPRFRLGAEYFYAHAYLNVAQLTTSKVDNAEGLSGFGSFNITPQLAAFGRYDWVKPTMVTAPKASEGYFNLGLSYEFTKTVDFALVYKRDSVLNGTIGTSNGTIGAGANALGTYDEIGIWSLVKW